MFQEEFDIRYRDWQDGRRNWKGKKRAEVKGFRYYVKDFVVYFIVIGKLLKVFEEGNDLFRVVF